MDHGTLIIVIILYSDFKLASFDTPSCWSYKFLSTFKLFHDFVIMASKNKKESTRPDSNDVKSDQKLQAVILTNYDKFSKSFRPISFESPNILMPLMNIPAIEYIIEFLAQNSVEEVSTTQYSKV